MAKRSVKKACLLYGLQAAVLSATGVAGTVLWQKKDLVKAILELQQFPEGWAQIQQNPETFLTRANEKGKDNLFQYLSGGRWRLVDQVADAYFWLNEKEEVLLLSQKTLLKDYWTWSASRSFFAPDEPEAAQQSVEEGTKTEE